MATGDDVVRIARAQIGKPYVWAKAGPNSFDCSGLVVYSFKNGAGISLPHFTGALISKGTEVRKADLKPGDLVFPIPSHVAIYSGNGKIVEAPRTGIPVRERTMTGFWRARRIIAPGTATGGSDVVDVNNPLVPDAIEQPIKDLVAVFRMIDNAVEFLTKPESWRRIGMLLVGFVLALIAVVQWETAKSVAGTVARGVKNA